MCCCFLCNFLNRCLHLYLLPEGKTVVKRKTVKNQSKTCCFIMRKKKNREFFKIIYFWCVLARTALGKCVGYYHRFKMPVKFRRYEEDLIVLPFTVVITCKEHTQRAIGCYLYTTICHCTNTSLWNIVLCWSTKTYLSGVCSSFLDLSIKHRMLSTLRYKS